MDRPMLFNDEMVRAILEGRKTQTRRIMKPQPEQGLEFTPFAPFGVVNGKGDRLICRHGKPGDQLWVRETWRGVVGINPPDQHLELGVARYTPDQDHCHRVEYRATQEADAEPWRPSHHMPRWASRITLEITGVRVERLQEISREDAEAEGLKKWPHKGDFAWGYDGGWEAGHSSPTGAFSALWKSIYGPESWDANPWVWVIEFRRVG